jgi:hypothetical protein
MSVVRLVTIGGYDNGSFRKVIDIFLRINRQCLVMRFGVFWEFGNALSNPRRNNLFS